MIPTLVCEQRRIVRFSLSNSERHSLQSAELALVEAAAKIAQLATAGCSQGDQIPIARDIAGKLATITRPADSVLFIASAATVGLRPGGLSGKHRPML